MDSRKKANNFLWAIVDRGGILFFQFLALVYLSQLVTPYEFGLIAILNIFINISAVLIDSGMVGALIKKQNIKDIDYYTLFVYNFIFSLIIYVFLFVLAPFVAKFYNDEIIVKLIRVLSLSIIFSSLGLVQLVKLTKALQLKKLALSTLISQLISVFFSIFLAKEGYGVWALVSLQLVSTLLNTLFLILVNRFVPRLVFSLKSFKEQFRFGAPLLVSNIIYIINVNIYSSLIGKFISTKDSGYFYQAYKLQNTPTGILSAVIDKVGFTLLSRVKENDEVVASAHRMYKVIYVIIIPIFIYVYTISDKLFLLIYSEKWNVAAPNFKILCLSIVPISVRVLNRNVLKSIGATKLILKLEIINALCIILILAFTLSYGLIYVCYGVVINSLISALLSMFYLSKKVNYKFSLQGEIILQPLTKSILILGSLNYVFSNFFYVRGYIETTLIIMLYVLIYMVFSYRNLKKVIDDNS